MLSITLRKICKLLVISPLSDQERDGVSSTSPPPPTLTAFYCEALQTYKKIERTVQWTPYPLHHSVFSTSAFLSVKIFTHAHVYTHTQRCTYTHTRFCFWCIQNYKLWHVTPISPEASGIFPWSVIAVSSPHLWDSLQYHPMVSLPWFLWFPQNALLDVKNRDLISIHASHLAPIFL